jgi:hypothetical protein
MDDNIGYVLRQCSYNLSQVIQEVKKQVTVTQVDDREDRRILMTERAPLAPVMPARMR